MNIKNIIFSLGLVVMLIATATSCSKDPEVEPRDLFTDKIVWDTLDRNANYAKQFRDNVYSFLPGGFNRVGGDFLDVASGDALPTRNSTTIEYYTNGILSSVQNPDAYWNNSYYGIRQANIFLANIDKVPTQASAIRQWKAEVRFIRAFLYFELWKRYGGVPSVGDKIFTLNDNLNIARNTFEEVLNYVISECDAIKADLITDPGVDTDWGRISKGAAIALKCRMYLYAASPLFNGGAPPSPQKSKGLVGYTNADPARWQKVLDAANEFRTITYYTLQGTFANIFTVKKNSEVILAKQSANNFDLEVNNAPVGYYNIGVQNGGRTSPTQNLVDAFPMLNGLNITDPASGYNAAAPYVNRDKRLDVTVFYNGLRWFQRAVETFDGGLDKPNTTVLQTKTGYYLRKFLGDFSNSTSYGAQSHNFVYFRFAEILLNQAEALNELGKVDSAVQNIILIRKRAGITAGTDNRYGIKNGINQNELRDLIRNERRIELSFEEHHFWDIRRWKTAPQELNGPLYGMQITRTAPNTFTYQKVVVGTATFSDKLYMMPLPYDEIIKNSALEQNPGW